MKFTPVPVLYSETKIVLENLAEKEMNSFFVKFLCHKSKEWEYEHEWRILRDKETCGYEWNESGALLEAVKPKDVYLGCRSEKN